MEDLAAEAEFSVGALYNFFPSKDKLYRCLIEQRSEQLSDEICQRLNRAAGPKEFIREYITGKIDLCLKYVDFLRLYTRERLGDRFTNDQLWWQTVAPIYEKIMSRLTTAFKEGMAQKCFRTGFKPEDLTVAMEGITDGFMYEWLQHPDEFSLEDKAETIISLFFNGVLAESE